MVVFAKAALFGQILVSRTVGRQLSLVELSGQLQYLQRPVLKLRADSRLGRF